LTAAGLGLGILPSRVAQRASQPLIKVPEAPSYRDEICLVVRKEQRKTAAIRCLLEAIKESWSR